MNIHVGNLHADAKDADLRKAFEAFGTVTKVRVIFDRETNLSRGFGFVEMSTQAEGEAAMAGLSGSELMGQRITTAAARAKTDDGMSRRWPRATI